MKFFNTATSKKEEFVSVDEGKVGIYACGMTLQSEPHNGAIVPGFWFSRTTSDHHEAF